MAQRRHLDEPRWTQVLIPGTGGKGITVFACRTGEALTRAVNERLARHGVRGQVVRRGGSWVFLGERPWAADGRSYAGLPAP